MPLNSQTNATKAPVSSSKIVTKTAGGQALQNPHGKPAPKPLSEIQHEFSFGDADFERVRLLIYHAAGISLSIAKKNMVYSRLIKRLRATGEQSFPAYLDKLETNPQNEMEAFVNALTTNLTAFFREPYHFPLLAEHLKKVVGKHPIKLWCSAASTGEEPYSMAITAIETLGSEARHLTIIASDLDTHVLEIAKKGVYAMNRVEKISPERLQRFFLKGTGQESGKVVLRSDVKRLIQFQRINLLDRHWSMLNGPFDAIFCRNVMIYFDKPTQHQILSRFVPLMQPEGLLFAGHSESFIHATDIFELKGHTVYMPNRRHTHATKL